MSHTMSISSNISSFVSQQQLSTRYNENNSNHNKISKARKTVLCHGGSSGTNSGERNTPTTVKKEKYQTTRRDILFASISASVFAPLLLDNSMLSLNAYASDVLPDGFKIYEDEADNYSLIVPEEWVFGEANVGTRKVVAFYPEKGSETNVNILITYLGADFTSMGSFGSAEAFGEKMVNMMDRSYLRIPGQEARLIDTKSKNGLYYVNYSLKKVGEQKKILSTVVGMNFNGIYNRMFTLTGQYYESEADKYEDSIKKVISSFKLGYKNA